MVTVVVGRPRARVRAVRTRSGPLVGSGGGEVTPPPNAQTTPIDLQEVSSQTATIHGAVQNFGDACTAYFKYGGPYDTPQTLPVLGFTTNQITVPGSQGSAPITAFLSGLTPDKYYYFAAFATNANGFGQGATEELQTFDEGETVHGDFNEPVVFGTPFASTGGFLSTTSTMTLSGQAHAGGILINLRFRYNLATEPVTTYEEIVATPATIGGGVTTNQPVSAVISSYNGQALSAQQSYRYWLRAFTGGGAVAEGGYQFGTVQVGSAFDPIPDTDPADNVAAFGAKLHGNVTDASPIFYTCTVGFRWRLKTGPGQWNYALGVDAFPTPITVPQTFSYDVGGLNPLTTYQFQAGATNPGVDPGDPGNDNGYVWSGVTEEFTTGNDPSANPSGTILTLTQMTGTPLPEIQYTGRFNAGQFGFLTQVRMRGLATYAVNGSTQLLALPIYNAPVTTTSSVNQPFTGDTTIEPPVGIDFQNGDAIEAWCEVRSIATGWDGSFGNGIGWVPSGPHITILINAQPLANNVSGMAVVAGSETQSTIECQAHVSDLNDSSSPAGVVAGFVEWYYTPPQGVEQFHGSTPYTSPYTADLTHIYTGLQAGTTYSFRCFMRQASAGGSGDSDTTSGTTDAGPGTGFVASGLTAHFIAYDQVTVQAFYTLASGTSALSWEYSIDGSTWFSAYVAGVAYNPTVTAASTSTRIDAVFADLTPGQTYQWRLRSLTGGQPQSWPGIDFTAAAAPALIGGTQPNYPGDGPGARGADNLPLNSKNFQLEDETKKYTHTWVVVQRPSSGFIDENNARDPHANIYFSKDYGGANVAAYTGTLPGGSGTFAANKGYDIVVYGTGNGCLKANWSIELWNPRIVTALGGGTPPLTLTTTNGAGSSFALVEAIKRYARWGDVIGVAGNGHSWPWWARGDGQQTSRHAYWETQTSTYKLMKHISLVGLCDKDDVSFGTQAGIWGSLQPQSKGGVHGLMQKRFRAVIDGQGSSTGSGASIGALLTSSINTGAFCNSNPTCRSGLLLGDDTRVYFMAGTLSKWWVRSHGEHRWDYRNSIFEFCGEHQFYLSRPGSKWSGMQNGHPAPNYFVNLSEVAGLGSKTTTGKPTYQITARSADCAQSGISSHSCITIPCVKCDSGCNPDYQGRIEDGDGTIYFKNCSAKSGSAAQSSNGCWTIANYPGTVVIDACTGDNNINCYFSHACQHQGEPVCGPDGHVYGLSRLWIKSYTMTGWTVGNTTNEMIRLNSAVAVRIDALTRPATGNNGKRIISIAGDPGGGNGRWTETLETGVSTDECWCATPSGQIFIPVGFIQLRMANPLSSWSGWPTGGAGTPSADIAFCWGQSIAGTTAPVIAQVGWLHGTPAADADIDKFYDGVCRPFLDNPSAQPNGYSCPAALTFP